MSVTVVAAPVALGYVILTGLISGISATVAAGAGVSQSIRAIAARENGSQSLDTININKEDIEQICREYDTVITDRDLLMKTLQEHGVDNLSVKGEAICAKVSEFNLLFTREYEGEAYKLKVYMECDVDEKDIVNELFSEYCVNTQEMTYEKIKERLEEKNLQIDEEEILEDNSIMLTINLN